MAVATSTALLIGGAALAGSSYLGAEAAKDAASAQSSAISGATSAELAATREQLAFLEEQIGLGEEDLQSAFADASALVQPLVGDFQATNLARSLAMGEIDPSQLPGFEFQQQQGQKALQNLLSSTSGGGLSGAGVQGAIEFGQGLASTQTSSALANLLPFVSLETGAQADLANLASGLGTNLANLRTGGASQNIASGLGDIGSITASGLLGQASTYTPSTSNLMTQGILGGIPSLLALSTAGSTGVPDTTGTTNQAFLV